MNNNLGRLNGDLIQKALRITPQEKQAIKQKVLNDDAVKAKLSEFGGLVTEDMINKGLCVLMEYASRTQGKIGIELDRYYVPILTIRNGHFYLDEKARPEALPLLEKEAWKRKLDLKMMHIENQKATLEDYDRSEMGRLTAFQEVQRIIEQYEDNKKIKGIWLVGQPGNGKSCLMCAMANYLNQFKYAGATMIQFSLFVSELYNAARNNFDNLNKRLKQLKLVDVLIIDDIGAEGLTDWVIDKVLFEILEARYNQQKLTCFTSNITKQDYFNRLLQAKSSYDDIQRMARAKRVMTRIDAMCGEIQLTGRNRREVY